MYSARLNSAQRITRRGKAASEHSFMYQRASQGLPSFDLVAELSGCIFRALKSFSKYLLPLLAFLAAMYFLLWLFTLDRANNLFESEQTVPQVISEKAGYSVTSHSPDLEREKVGYSVTSHPPDLEREKAVYSVTSHPPDLERGTTRVLTGPGATTDVTTTPPDLGQQPGDMKKHGRQSNEDVPHHGNQTKRDTIFLSMEAAKAIFEEIDSFIGRIQVEDERRLEQDVTAEDVDDWQARIEGESAQGSQFPLSGLSPDDDPPLSIIVNGKQAGTPLQQSEFEDQVASARMLDTSAVPTLSRKILSEVEVGPSPVSDAAAVPTLFPEAISEVEVGPSPVSDAATVPTLFPEAVSEVEVGPSPVSDASAVPTLSPKTLRVVEAGASPVSEAHDSSTVTRAVAIGAESGPISARDKRAHAVQVWQRSISSLYEDVLYRLSQLPAVPESERKQHRPLRSELGRRLFRRWQDMSLSKRANQHSRGKRRMKGKRSQRYAKGRASTWRKWLPMVILLCSIVAIIGCMFPGGPRSQHGAMPRQHAHVGDAGPPFVGTATLKVPPAWSVERSAHYSLRSWISDLVLWSTATDVEPQRMGAIAALQVSGSAKELVRELAPEQLANGVVDPQTGQHVTGLMLLVQTLARRYAPLDGEASTKAVSDFLNFNRLPGESVDALLVRFDVLRNRAQMRGGLGVNPNGLSWLLLRALGLNADLVDRLLQPLNGQLPQTDLQLQQLLERIRRQGHLFEGGMRHSTQQAGVGDPGTYLAFPTFSSQGASANSNWNPASAAAPAWGMHDSSATMSASIYAGHSADPDLARMAGGSSESYLMADEDQCQSCGMYYRDDDLTSATSSDTGSLDADAQAYASVSLGGSMRSDDDARGNVLYQEYLAARRRWRRWAGKPPRRYRRTSYRPRPQHQLRLDRGPYARTYSAFLPASAFAGGKGGGKGKSFSGGKGSGFKRSNTNPRGKDGKTLKCAKCGSESHLWRKCPLVVGNSTAPAAQPAHLAHASSCNAPTALALTSAPAFPAYEQWSSASAHAAGHLSGVAFHFLSGGSSQAPSEAGTVRTEVASFGSAYLDEMTRLESASQVGIERQRRSRRSRNEPPSWEAGSQSLDNAEPEDEERASAVASEEPPRTSAQIQPCLPGRAPPQQPPPMETAPTEEELNRRRTVVQLSSLLHAWWEGEDDGAVVHESYHLRTRLEGNRVGLLVDPGAHDNLVGSHTAERMSEQTGIPNVPLRMSKRLQVEGVGKSAQTAETASRVALRLSDMDGQQVSGTFTAPVIPDSSLPPLLGLRSLRNMGAVIDTRQQVMILPGPAGLKIECSPGTRSFKLEMSPSGHLILPVDQVENTVTPARPSEKELEFNMTVREQANVALRPSPSAPASGSNTSA